ncbi:intein/RHS repeat-associated protein [Tumebacillus sp. BK434]|uniref:polymorphic toxin-type HINT domain-containing protein n=1 Tax=Tumebacillus sp. BK434 TaxID=2512169 RepID=UPI0010493BAF|nr:polymorphic toxin-type HINT domain-containing protein [Tumebacillus sp. BK434]TCP52650.1 intein/RHS repeat-associated protein [Tumebacillus sp. BK434]
MGKRLRRQTLSILLIVTLVVSSLLQSFSTKASAAAGNEWDPLLDWLPENGQTFDPAGDIISAAVSGQNHTTGGTGNAPIVEAADPAPATPQEPVNIATGALVLTETDFSYSSYGPKLEIARSYTSDKTDNKTMFGHGWSIPQERRLQIYADFAMADQKADGTVETYVYTKNDPDMIVETYDGDDTIWYPLHLGSYAAQDAANKKELIRRGPTDYLLREPQGGTNYAFHGYYAKWRTDAPKTAGKLLRYADNVTGLTMFLEYDEQGRMKKMQGNTRPSLTFGYQGASTLVYSVTDLGGLVYYYGYDANENLTKVTRPDGSKVEYTYDSSHRITSRAENGVATYFEYSGGKVSAIKDAKKRTLYSYTYEGSKVTRTDSDGHRTVYTIGANQKITQKVDPDGTTTSYAYNADGKVTSLTTPQGTTTMEYDAKGNMTRRVEPLGRETRIQYHAVFDKPIRIVQPGDAVWEYTYTDRGAVQSVKEPSGKVTNNEVSWFWQVVLSRTDNAERVTTFDYNDYAELSDMTDPKGQVTSFVYDNSNRLKEVHYPGGKKLTLEYQGGNRKPSVTTGPMGLKTRAEYDKGRLVREYDELNNLTAYEYNDLGQLARKIEPGDRVTAYTYTPLGQLASATYPGGRTVSYKWDANGRLQSKAGTGVIATSYEYDIYGNVAAVTTPKGTTRYERDALGRVTQEIDPLKQETKYTYNAAGLVATVQDAKNQTVSFTYDADGQVLTKTDPIVRTESYTYDDLGNPLTVTDAEGRVTRYQYNVIGQLESVTDPLNRVTSYTYDATGNKLSETFGSLTTRYEYDAAGRMNKRINPAGGETEYTYDPKGQLLSTKDPRGKTTTYTYNPAGQLLTQKDPLGNVYTFSYDAAGRLSGVKDPKGHEVAYKYDLTARTTEVVKDEQLKVRYQYDEAGNLVSFTNSRNHVTRYEYDAANRLTKTITPAGEIAYAYDVLGQLTSETDPLKHTTRYTYDALGRVLTVTNKANEVTAYTYDPQGRFTEVRLPNGTTERTEYNLAGQVTLEQDAGGGQTKYEYDALGRLTQKTNPRGHFATYQYDKLGRLTAVTDPKGYKTALTYDANGNLLSRTNELEQTWSYVYDDANRLTAVNNPLHQQTKYEYDKNSNLTRVIDVMNRETILAYDKLNRLTATTDTGGFTTRYEYDGEDNLLREIDHDGVAKEYTYDALNREVAVKDREGNTTTTSYDARGNVTGTVDANGAASSYAYDAMGRLTSVTDAKQGVTQYRYDAMGNQTEQIDPLGHSTVWAYDAMSNVTSERDGENGVTRYEYDRMGNQTARIDALGKRTEYAYDERQLLTAIQTPGETPSLFEYDEIGRLTRAKNGALEEVYSYDGLNRVTAVTNPQLSKTVSYEYDAVGNRTKITDPEGRVISYTYDSRSQIRSMTDPEGLVTSYAYDPYGQVTEIKGGDQTVTSYTYDHNRRPTKIHTTTTTGVLSTFNYTYDGLGNILTQTEEDGAVTQFTYDKLNRVVEALYPIEKIKTIRNTYYTPPLNKLFPNGADGSGEVDTSAPKVPQAAQGGNSAGEVKTPGNGNGGGNGNGKGNSGNNGNGNGNSGNNGNGNGNGKGNGGDKNPNSPGNGHAYGKNKRTGTVPSDYTPEILQELGYPPSYVPEDPDFFLNPVERVTYTYDAAGNRTSMTDDYGLVTYTYDKANRLTDVDGDTYTYDANGNLTSKMTAYGQVNYKYNADNLLTEVNYPDKTYVHYEYDAFGRKVSRDEQYYDLNGPGASMGNGQAILPSTGNNGNGNAYGLEKNPNKGNNGNGNNGNGNGNNGNGNGNNGNGNNGNGNNGNGNNGNGNNGNGNNAGPGGVIKNYHLKKEQTDYLYDGNALLSEYNGKTGETFAQYYRGADDQVVSRKMFGFQGRKEQGYLGNLRDRGHHLFYHYDGMGNVTDLTDYLGSEVLKYRYDAFGGVFTQLWTPYNQVGLTGKSYDIKASLMDYSARWYSPSVGRFTTQDTWTGLGDLPQTLNRYAYALNNPINITDPSGHAPCYEDDNGDLRCGYSPNPDDWGNRGGGSGGGGGGGTDNGWTPPPPPPPPNPDELEPPPLPPWMNKDGRIATLLEKAGMSPQEISMMFQLLSAGVDSIPVLGNIKSAVEAITGYDIISGEKLGFWDRAVSGVTALIPGGGALKNALKAGMKTAKALDKAATIERKLDDVPIGCGNCFTAGTLIETENGKKPIEEIDVGDKVLSKDDATGKIAYKEVNGTFQRDTEEIYTIQIGDQKLTTTGEHPFYVHNHGWVRSKNLKAGDRLDTASGMTLEVQDIQVKQETIRVYNFSVTDYHSYFVSDQKIWTHNTKTCPIFGSKDYQARFQAELGRSQYPGHELHHGYPQQFEADFRNANIDIHAPKNIYELPEPLHRTVTVNGEKYRTGVHSAPLETSWNGQWREFFRANPNASAESMEKFREKLGNDFAINNYLGGVKK